MDRNQFEELLKDLQQIKVYNLDSDSDVLCELYNQWQAHTVAENLNVDEHRWYELSTSIIQVGDYFIGARGVTKMYSEMSSYSDIGIYLKFFEVERKQIVAYEYVPVE